MAAPANLLWGTNPDGSTYYTGRVHMVLSDHPWVALCGLPVALVWEQRPSTPERLCPECCQLAVAELFPATGRQRLLHDFVGRTGSSLVQPPPITSTVYKDLD